MQHHAQNGDGQAISPRAAVVPILKQLELGVLSVIGTGFYVTRYGLFLTAGHVLDDVVDWDASTVKLAYVCHRADDTTVYLRRVLQVSRLREADLAIGQADNYFKEFPDAPLSNLRAPLTTVAPAPGTSLVTFAYPENEVLDFRNPDAVPRIISDYFDGTLLRHAQESENPLLPYPHFETSIEIRGGASGGPVFDDKQRVIGINWRGWDFRGGEHEGNNLSSIVPVSALLPLEVQLSHVPRTSWEYAQIPEHHRARPLTVSELGIYGHILFEPSI